MTSFNVLSGVARRGGGGGKGHFQFLSLAAATNSGVAGGGGQGAMPPIPEHFEGREQRTNNWLPGEYSDKVQRI